MGVSLSTAEAWAFVEASHTGILTTLRADGHPVPLPVWFVVLDEVVYVRTPAKSRKVSRLRRDPRASFLVEAGERWRELQAVVLFGEARVLDGDDERCDRVVAATTAKYAAFREAPQTLPEATRKHYGSGTATIAFSPTQDPVSWDNRRIRRI